MEDRIVIDQEIQHGTPVIRGTRVPVARITDGLAGGMTNAEITKEYEEKPSNEDIYQVVTYAVAKDSESAILVYPQALHHQAVGAVGPVRVHALSYRIDGDLEEAGEKMLGRLLRVIEWGQTSEER